MQIGLYDNAVTSSCMETLRELAESLSLVGRFACLFAVRLIERIQLCDNFLPRFDFVNARDGDVQRRSSQLVAQTRWGTSKPLIE